MDLMRAAFHVGIVLALTGPVNDDQINALKAEAAAIWRPYGVDIAWFNPNGDCASDEQGFAPLVDWMVWLVDDSTQTDDSVLGSVRFQAGAPGDTIRLRYRPLSQMVLDGRIAGWSIRAMPAPLRDHYLGQAVGRVVAHELGHMLLAFPAHHQSGLMRSNFVPSDLIGWDREALRLSKEDVRRLDTHLLRRFNP